MAGGRQPDCGWARGIDFFDVQIVPCDQCAVVDARLRSFSQDRAQHFADPLLLHFVQADPHRQPEQTLR